MKTNPIEYIVILCTCPNEQLAELIATELVQAKLAACVNILPGVKSIYSWEGKLESGAEHLLVIKTKAELFAEVAAMIKAKHNYECPEIIALPIVQGDHGYLRWLSSVFL